MASHNKHYLIGGVASQNKHYLIGGVASQNKHYLIGGVVSQNKHYLIGGVASQNKHYLIGGVASHDCIKNDGRIRTQLYRVSSSPAHRGGVASHLEKTVGIRWSNVVDV